MVGNRAADIVGSALVLSLVAILPLAAADEIDENAEEPKCIIVIEPQPGWDMVLFSVDLELSDEEMAELEAEVDANDSGAITPAEVAAYENDSHHIRTDFYDLGEMKMALDYEPSTHVLFHTGLTGFEGQVGGLGKKVVTEHREHFFTSNAAGTHLIEGGNQTSAAYSVIELVILRAPPDWRITAVNGTDYNASSLQMPGFDVKSLYSIEYTYVGEATDGPGRTKDVFVVPGPGLFLTAALAMLAVLFGRTLRR